jgi:hypothetical protein
VLAYTAKTAQWLLAEFWIPAYWPPYSPDLNVEEFSICSVLQPKGQSTPQANLAMLRPSIDVE